jgi:molybdate transport system regulatory protein
MPAKKPKPVEIAARFHINCGREFAFGPGKAALLEHIAKTGSISEAAKLMGMSYMRAWKIVKSLEKGAPEPLVRTIRGGSQRGGAVITPTGAKILELYRELEASSHALTRTAGQKLAKLLLG